jgi:hypothetical protein
VNATAMATFIPRVAAAAILGTCTPRVLDALVESGRVRARKAPGAHTRFLLADLLAVVNDGASPPTAPAGQEPAPQSPPDPAPAETATARAESDTGHARALPEPSAPPALTDRQRQVLGLIVAGVAERGRPPTIREIGLALGTTNPEAAHGHIRALARKGYISTRFYKERSIIVLRLPDGRRVTGWQPTTEPAS